MKALLCKQLPKGKEWVYEVKFDGIRALAVKRGESVILYSRAGNVLGGKFGPIIRQLADLPVDKAVLDGELVALDPEGRPSFQLLQSYDNLGPDKPPLVYYVFDALNLAGKDVTGLPLQARKSAVAQLLEGAAENLLFSAGIRAGSRRVERQMRARGLEGVMAKRKDSQYETGRRSGAWAKFKWCHEQEFVIGGFTRPRGSRQYFGAVLVGYYQGQRLIFAGKVGTGFDERGLASLYRTFQKLVQPECPFAGVPRGARSSADRGLTARQMRLCAWLRPELVCQVRFAEWTRDGFLRQPSFLGLREDKKAAEVAREKPTGG